MRYAIAMHDGLWVVHCSVTGKIVTGPLTSEQAQEKVRELNALVPQKRFPEPVPVWTRGATLTAWFWVDDTWYGIVRDRAGVRYIPAGDLRPDG